MQIKLDPEFAFVKKDGKFNQRAALIDAGVKAAVCFKEGSISPEEIRKTETNDQLIKRGLNTILSDHTTPTEHPNVGLEITEIPKILCMILNNEHQYTSCERSLRYTEIQNNPYISSLENFLYEKWLAKLQNVLPTKYSDFFRKFNKDENAAKITIKKLAQENARDMVTVFMPTTLTYSAPYAQMNKIGLYMQSMINSDTNTKFQKLIVPYLKDFVSQLKDLDVLITNSQAKQLCPDLKVESNDEFLYKNNKNIELSLFADKNKFSGIYLPEEFGVGFSHNFYPSFASFAQFHRHRTIDFQMIIEENNFQPYIPPIIADDKELVAEWLHDMNLIKHCYPQGQLIRTNASGSLSNLISYVGKERACDRAQLETQNTFTNEFIPQYYNALIETGKIELSNQLKPYVKRLRCQYPDYHCPNNCGHPRVEREF